MSSRKTFVEVACPGCKTTTTTFIPVLTFPVCEKCMKPMQIVRELNQKPVSRAQCGDLP